MARAKSTDQTITDETASATANGLPFVVEDATEFHSTRGRSLAPNPLLPYLKESYETQTPKQVRVTPDQVDAVKNDLHRAAKTLEIGVDIPVEPQDDGTVLVKFRGRDRRSRQPLKTTANL